jgi:pyruvate/2-oxoglutarate dehydrogenase complex dihydrolipoamide acyltransferase (E2) component
MVGLGLDRRAEAAEAQKPGTATTPPPAAKKTDESPVVSPRADRLLREMGEYLASATHLSFRADVTFDQVLPSGQKIPRGGQTGEWRVTDNDVLCAKWYEVEGATESCHVMRHLGKSEFEWGGNAFLVFRGNPKGL